MAEQEASLAVLREQASELRAARAQLERALAASTAESAATIGALKASMQRQTADALELEQLRWVHCAHCCAKIDGHNCWAAQMDIHHIQYAAL